MDHHVSIAADPAPFMEKDRELRTLFLLEGRRIRGDGHMVVLVPGFLEFVKILDGILKEMAAKGELLPHLNPQAQRSGLMGTIEGLLRDQLLARPSRFPASYSEADSRAIFSAFLSSCLTNSSNSSRSLSASDNSRI